MRNMQAMLNWAIENGSHGSAPTLDGAVQQGDPEFEIKRQHLMAVGFSSSSSFSFFLSSIPPFLCFRPLRFVVRTASVGNQWECSSEFVFVKVSQLLPEVE